MKHETRHGDIKLSIWVKTKSTFSMKWRNSHHICNDYAYFTYFKILEKNIWALSLLIQKRYTVNLPNWMSDFLRASTIPYIIKSSEWCYPKYWVQFLLLDLIMGTSILILCFAMMEDTKIFKPPCAYVMNIN